MAAVVEEERYPWPVRRRAFLRLVRRCHGPEHPEYRRGLETAEYVASYFARALRRDEPGTDAAYLAALEDMAGALQELLHPSEPDAAYQAALEDVAASLRDTEEEEEGGEHLVAPPATRVELDELDEDATGPEATLRQVLRPPVDPAP